MWRSGRASGLHEIEEYWSLDDLVMAHRSLDLEDDLAIEAKRRAELEAKKTR